MARLPLILSLLAVGVLGASPPADRPEAGLAVRAEAPRDAGLSLRAEVPTDAGRPSVPDAGRWSEAGASEDATDAGRAVIASWEKGDGGLLDGGVTDAIALSVGASLDVAFPLQVLLMLCDDPRVVRADILADRIVLNGVSPGATHCGFWFNRGSIPARYIAVVVLQDEGLAEAPEKAPAALQKKDPQEPPLNPEWQFETPAWVH